MTGPGLVLATLLAAAANAVAPAPVDAPVPMAEEPYHRLLFENAVAAVYDVVLPPGAVMRHHRHPTDHLAVLIASGTLRNEVVGLAARESYTGPPGTLVYLPAGPPHRQANVGAEAVHFIAAEILAPAPPGPDTTTAGERPGCELLLKNAAIAAWRCRTPPGAVLPAPPPGLPGLRVAIAAGTVEGTGRGPEPAPARMERAWEFPAGDAVWLDGTVPRELVNVGQEPLDVVEIFWRPSADALAPRRR